jgi:hypothetical protein
MQNDVQSGVAANNQEMTNKSITANTTGFVDPVASHDHFCPREPVPLTGVELSTASAGDSTVLPTGGAESGAVHGRGPSRVLSVLQKLTGALTADERAVLARMLRDG